MNWTLIIITLILGLVLLTLEIVALPGMLAGCFGIGLIAFSIWSTFTVYGTMAGTIVLLSAMAVCVVLLIIFMKTKTWKKFSMNDESNSTVNQIDKTSITIGAKGTTIARLAPTGKALIAGEQVEVHAINKFIDPDKQIEVVAIDGYRIDVKEVNDERF